MSFVIAVRIAQGNIGYTSQLDFSEPTPSTSLAYVTAQYVPTIALKAPSLPQDASKDKVRGIVIEAALRHGVDPDLLLSVAKCESGLRTEASNPRSTASGIFQFLTSTFQSQAKKYGVTGSKNDPYVQADLAAQMISQGGITHWNESRSCWGKG